MLSVCFNSVNVRYNLCILHGEYQERYEEVLVCCEEFSQLVLFGYFKGCEVKKRIKGLKSTIQVLKMEEEEAKQEVEVAAKVGETLAEIGDSGKEAEKVEQ